MSHITSPAPPSRPTSGWQLRLWRGLRGPLQPLMRAIIAKRRKAGKEDPKRYTEKFGKASAPRPDGPLVWLHAVGLGEVMALRPLVDAMREVQPDLQVLITSTAKSSAGVIGANLPQGAIHQFLPLDGPDFMRAFLDHWRPDLAIWSEQDLWPGAIDDTFKRGIPLAYVNARITEESFAKRRKSRGLYRDMFSRFSRIIAQDPGSAQRLRELGAKDVALGRSLKPASPPLKADMAELERLKAVLAGRKIWVAASTHPRDEGFVLGTQLALWQQDPSALLILAPRMPERGPEIEARLTAAELPFATRSKNEIPKADHAIWLADSLGELGLWYRLGDAAFLGGTIAPIGGHNPWEAICLGLPVFHGPETHNFQADYAELDQAGLAQLVEPHAPSPFAMRLLAPKDDMRAKAETMVDEARAALKPMAEDLLNLLRNSQ